MRAVRSIVAVVLIGTTLAMGNRDATASAAPPDTTPPDTTLPPAPAPSVLVAPAQVSLGDVYSYTSTSCGTGWTISDVDWYIWGPTSHQPVLPQYGAVLDNIVQSDSGVVVTVVAGQSGRPDPLWYTTYPVESYFYERLGLACEQNGATDLMVSAPVKVVPPSGASWGVWPIGAYDAVTGLNVMVSSPWCVIGSLATLQLVAVPGAAGQLVRTVVDGPEAGWTSATFAVDFRRGTSWNVVDYVFTCPTASGTITSTFHHPDWGFILASGGTLPSSGGATPPLVLLALVLVVAGESLRRAAQQPRARAGRT